MRKFCFWQYKSLDDTIFSWTCLSDLDNGKAYQCPFKTKITAKRRCINFKILETKQAKEVVRWKK